MFNQFKGNNLLAFFIISVAILFISISLIIAKEIHSTKDGGNWNDKKTWVGSIIPQKEDDVVLNDTVVVTDIHYCDSLTIMPGAVLEVHEKGSFIRIQLKWSIMIVLVPQ